MSNPKVIKTVVWKGRNVEILLDCDWTYLARLQGSKSVFGVTKTEIDPPAESEPRPIALFEIRNQREKPAIPENNRS